MSSEAEIQMERNMARIEASESSMPGEAGLLQGYWNTLKASDHGGNVGAIGEVEDACAELDHADAFAHRGDGEIDGFGKLEFATRRWLHFAAGSINRGIEQPAIHPDQRAVAVPGQGGFIDRK